MVVPFVARWLKLLLVLATLSVIGIALFVYYAAGDSAASVLALTLFCAALLARLAPLAWRCARHAWRAFRPRDDNNRDRIDLSSYARHLELMGREDFSPNDFEALSALDAGNINALGASPADISRLPRFPYRGRRHEDQTPVEGRAEMEDDCSICLEPMQEGETVMLLPCMHVFHAAEIETWLEARATCPVCKGSVRT